MLNVRLDTETEKKLKAYADKHDLSKTAVVKEALALYLTSKEPLANPYELGVDLFGSVASGETTNSQNYKALLKKKLSEKYAH